jgi:hypothetical protein
MKEKSILTIIKFGQKKFIDDFVDNGHIYMNSLSYFKKLEKENIRKDEYENSTSCLQANGARLSVEIDGNFVEFASILGPIITANDKEDDFIKVFCMYSVLDDIPIDSRIENFGDSCCVILIINEFFRRIDNAAEKKNLIVERKIVRYVNSKTYEGEMGFFRKFSDFSFQNEYRLAVKTNDVSPLSLIIGNISDITYTVSSRELITHGKFIKNNPN